MRRTGAGSESKIQLKSLKITTLSSVAGQSLGCILTHVHSLKIITHLVRVTINLTFVRRLAARVSAYSRVVSISAVLQSDHLAPAARENVHVSLQFLCSSLL